jgi:hypothetical protein
MFSRLREHFGTAGLVVAIVALVATLGGGAYAASGGGSAPSGGGDAGNFQAGAGGNSAKATASVEATASVKGKKGPRGKTGKTGPAGPAGPQGSAGANGKEGARGAEGEQGPEGKQGSTGLQGPKGKQGLAGAPGPSCDEEGKCLLPSGATETGAWGAASNSGQKLWTTISFPLRLSSLPEAQVVSVAEGTAAPNCPGTAGDPQAAAGFLCLYEAVHNKIETLVAFKQPDATSGVTLKMVVEKEEVAPGEFVFPPASSVGSWAVTAP